MFLVSSVVQSFRPLDLMQNAARLVGKNICMNIEEKKTLNYAGNKAIGAYEKDCSPVMVGNAFVVEKQNLNFWHLTM